MKRFVLITMLFISGISRAQVYDMLVAKEGSGAYYSLRNFFKKLDVEWDPVPKTIAVNSPSNLSGEGYRLTWWADVPEGTGYVIIINDSAIGFSDTTHFSDTTADPSVMNTYKVKSVATYGNLSPASNDYIVAASPVRKISETQDAFTIEIKDNILTVSEPVNIIIFSLSGISVFHKEYAKEASLSEHQKGIYILKAENCSGQSVTRKIIH